MSEQRYFGLYCEQCGVWWVQPDSSKLVFYPAPEIAKAHLNDRGWDRRLLVHLWKVQEFGKEEYVGKPTRSDAEICPRIIPTKRPLLAI